MDPITILAGVAALAWLLKSRDKIDTPEEFWKLAVPTACAAVKADMLAQNKDMWRTVAGPAEEDFNGVIKAHFTYFLAPIQAELGVEWLTLRGFMLFCYWDRYKENAPGKTLPAGSNQASDDARKPMFATAGEMVGFFARGTNAGRFAYADMASGNSDTGPAAVHSPAGSTRPAWNTGPGNKQHGGVGQQWNNFEEYYHFKYCTLYDAWFDRTEKAKRSDQGHFSASHYTGPGTKLGGDYFICPCRFHWSTSPIAGAWDWITGHFYAIVHRAAGKAVSVASAGLVTGGDIGLGGPSGTARQTLDAKAKAYAEKMEAKGTAYADIMAGQAGQLGKVPADKINERVKRLVG